MMSGSPSLTLSLPAAELPQTEAARWWVVHTRPRCEKKMDEWLATHGLEHYLPTRPRLKVYPGKKVTFHHPLFAGYAFGRFSLLQRNAVYGSDFAAGVLEVNDQARFLAELEAIRRALENGLAFEEIDYLATGQKARIATGKLRGLEGIVVRRAGGTKLILSVEMLQRSLSMEIDSSWLEPAG